MIVTECKTDFLGHQIVARNSWGPTYSLKALTGENRLYIDGKVVETHTEILAISNTPIMRGVIQEGDKAHIVEVYARSGLIRVKLCIHIDGRRVAGEEF